MTTVKSEYSLTIFLSGIKTTPTATLKGCKKQFARLLAADPTIDRFQACISHSCVYPDGRRDTMYTVCTRMGSATRKKRWVKNCNVP